MQVSGRTCIRSIKIPYSSGTLLDGCFLASFSSQHVGRHASLLSSCKNLVMDVLVGQVLKVLPSLLLSLWLLRDVCCADQGSLAQSVKQWQYDFIIYDKSYQQC